MKPTAEQVRQALRNHYRPLRTNGSRAKAAIDHAKNSTKTNPGEQAAQLAGKTHELHQR